VPRKRPHFRVDHIADSATEVFIQYGFVGAKISQIAHRAHVGPGTIYLYAESKEALFDLAIRRALEDPTVWTMILPHPAPEPGAVADALWRCLQNASHFPQLWLAADSPPPDDVPREVEGILRELYVWLHRYRRAIKLVERCAGDWPEVGQLFYRRFWRGGIQRVADYLARRMKERRLPSTVDARATAHLVVESLAWMAVHREWTHDGIEVAESVAEATALGLLVPAICGRGT
jgi:AcrR family transcriptional regulator